MGGPEHRAWKESVVSTGEGGAGGTEASAAVGVLSTCNHNHSSTVCKACVASTCMHAMIHELVSECCLSTISLASLAFSQPDQAV